MSIINEYIKWAKIKTAKKYANDLQDIRDGLLGKTINKTNVNNVFSDIAIRKVITKKELNIDIFDICNNLDTVISKLKIYKSEFLDVSPLLYNYWTTK